MVYAVFFSLLYLFFAGIYFEFVVNFPLIWHEYTSQLRQYLTLQAIFISVSI